MLGLRVQLNQVDLDIDWRDWRGQPARQPALWRSWAAGRTVAAGVERHHRRPAEPHPGEPQQLRPLGDAGTGCFRGRRRQSSGSKLSGRPAGPLSRRCAPPGNRNRASHSIPRAVPVLSHVAAEPCVGVTGQQAPHPSDQASWLSTGFVEASRLSIKRLHDETRSVRTLTAHGSGRPCHGRSPGRCCSGHPSYGVWRGDPSGAFGEGRSRAST